MKTNPVALQTFISVGDADNTKFSSAVPNSSLRGLSHKRYAGEAGNQMSITVTDTTAYQLENSLMMLKTDMKSRTVSMQYGYGVDNSQSFYGMIYDYSPTIYGNYVEVSISAVGFNQYRGSEMNIQNPLGTPSPPDTSKIYGPPTPVGPLPPLLPRSTSFKDLPLDIRSPSDVFRAICTNLGWKVGTVVDTRPISAYLLTGFNLRLLSDANKYITNKLVPIAVSTSGLGDYKFWTTSGPGGTTTAHFAPATTLNSATAGVLTTDKGNITTSGVFSQGPSGTLAKSSKTYVRNSQSSEVVDWNPIVSGGMLMAVGGSGVESSSFDEMTNDDYYTKASQEVENLPKDGQRQWMATDKRYQSIKLSSVNPTTADSKVSSTWQKVMNTQYVVEARIIGDPSRQVMETLSFEIYAGNKLHHTSGKYLVTGVEDVISSNGFYTNLELLKNSSSTGPSPSRSDNR